MLKKGSERAFIARDVQVYPRKLKIKALTILTFTIKMESILTSGLFLYCSVGAKETHLPHSSHFYCPQ